MANQEDTFFEAARKIENQSSKSEAVLQGKTTKPVQTRIPLRRRAVRILVLLTISYFLICLALFIFQKNLVYPRRQEERLVPNDFGFALPQARGVTTRTADNMELKGWQITSSRGGVDPDVNLAKSPLMVLYFTGNAGNKSDYDQRFRKIANLGAEVVCFDYRGYGDSEGYPSEEGLATDARAAWQFLISKKVAPQSILLYGYSIGGGVAVRLAAELCNENTPPAGLVIESSFKSLTDVASRQYWFVPVSLILSERFPSIQRIPSITCPLLEFHGTKDTLIPIQHGRDLFDAARDVSSSGVKKQFVELLDCDHTNVGYLNAVEYRNALRSFIEKIAPSLKPSTEEKQAISPRSQPVRKFRLLPHTTAKELKNKARPENSEKKPTTP